MPPARLRPHILAGVGAFLLLLCLYMFWFRDSGLVRVNEVSITGLTESPRLRQQLADEALTMTTLHVNHGRLDNVLAGYPAVDAARGRLRPAAHPPDRRHRARARGRPRLRPQSHAGGG